jgi:hypothetical protein
MKEQPKHKIEYLRLDELIPYARNSRTHSDEQVAQIAGSIREFGFTNPVLVSDKNDIIAGHGRVLAAQRLGLPTVPCIRLGYLTPAQRRAYVIADNRLALNADWDKSLLLLELKELDAEDFDLSLLGFGAKELADMMLEQDGESADSDPPPAFIEEFLIVVNCSDEKQQQEIFEELTERGLTCKVMS